MIANIVCVIKLLLNHEDVDNLQYRNEYELKQKTKLYKDWSVRWDRPAMPIFLFCFLFDWS